MVTWVCAVQLPQLPQVQQVRAQQRAANQHLQIQRTRAQLGVTGRTETSAAAFPPSAAARRRNNLRIRTASCYIHVAARSSVGARTVVQPIAAECFPSAAAQPGTHGDAREGKGREGGLHKDFLNGNDGLCVLIKT